MNFLESNVPKPTMPNNPLPPPIFAQLDLANALTLMGLLISFLGTIAAIQAQFYGALILLILAGLVDLVDGSVARRISRTTLQAAVGEQVDGLVDLCAFGFSPVIFAYCFGLQTPIDCLILMGYLGAAGLRTAYFGCVGLASDPSSANASSFYIGLPVAYSAVFLPLVGLVTLSLPTESVQVLLAIVLLLHTIAMLSPLRIPKPQGIWLLPFLVGGLILTGIYSWAIVNG